MNVMMRNFERDGRSVYIQIEEMRSHWALLVSNTSTRFSELGIHHELLILIILGLPRNPSFGLDDFRSQLRGGVWN